MKKLRLFASVSVLSLTLSFGALSFSKASAETEDKTQETTAFSIGTSVTAGLNNSSSLVGDGEVFDYTVGITNHTVTNNSVSTLFTSWTDFDTASGSALKLGTWSKTDYNLAGNAYGPYYNYGTTDSNCMVRVNWMQNITYKLTFNKSALLMVSNAALSGIAASDNVIRIRVYKESGGVVTRLSETPLYDGTNTAQAANYFGGEYTLLEGESFYFEYGCTGAYEKSLKYATLGEGIFPTFAADTSKVTNAVKTDLVSVVSASYGASGKAVKMGKTTFAPVWGTLAENKTFDLIENNALQTTAKRDDGIYAAVYAGGSGKMVRTNGAKQRFLLKITSEENLKISFDSEAIASATNGTAYYTIYEGVSKDGSFHYTKHFEKSVGAEAAEAGVLALELHVPAGNEVVFEIYGSAQGTNIYLLPTVIVDPDAYDETKKYDFTAVLELASYKTEKLSALGNAYNGLDRTNYLEADLADIDAAYTAVVQDINAAINKAGVDLALKGYEETFAGIITVSELSALRAQYKGELDTFLSSVKAEEYSSENYAKIKAFIDEGKSKIDSAVTENAMSNAVKYAKSEIALVAKVEAGTPSKNTESGSGSSCSAGVGFSAMTLIALFAFGVAFKKKED
ncbi:MAG: hypothetical protein IJY62_01045 [Clostridia bacterium]|nr:hypothetical protein [Clostridia bacterium]